MDLLKEIRELKETVGNEIAEANKEIKKAGGDLNTGDIEMIDKLAHAIKSLVTTCAMLEADEDYSEKYEPMGPYYGGGYSRRERHETRTGYSGNYGGYARNDSRFGRENRNGSYSRGMDWNDQLRQMMDEAPDEATRMDIKKLMERMAG